MKQQNYANHRRYVTLYHFITPTIILVLLIMGIMQLCCHCSGSQQCSASSMSQMHSGLYEVLSALVLTSLWWYLRRFAIKAQDRAIHAEENFRYFIRTGKPLDPRLRWGQVIALRFASDDEYTELAERAIKENLKADDIKKAIKNWRADDHRA